LKHALVVAFRINSHLTEMIHEIAFIFMLDLAKDVKVVVEPCIRVWASS
jgi:hypothetical protein